MNRRPSLQYSTLWSIISKIGSVTVKSFVVIYLTRLLGPNEYGHFTAVISISSLFAVFADFGISPSTAKFLSEKRYFVTRLVKRSSKILSLALAIVTTLFLLLSEHIFELLNIRYISGLEILVICLVLVEISKKFFKKIFEGLSRVDISSKIALALDWSPWALAIVFCKVFEPESGAALVGRIVGFFIITLALTYFFKSLEFNKTSRQEDIKLSKILKYAFPLIFTAVSFYIYTKSDILIVQAYLGEEAVGYYGVAVQFLNILHVPAAAIGTATAASFVSFKKDKNKNLGNLFLRVARSVLIMFLPLGMGLIIIANSLIPFIFGNQYEESAMIAIIYVPYLILKALSGTYSLALDYLGYANKRAIAVSLSAFSNVLLNFILVPKYGIIGAAWATQITYVPLAIWYMLLVGKESKIKIKQLLRLILPIASSTLTMAGILLLVQYFFEIHVLVLITIGIVTYFLASIVYKSFKLSEINSLIKTII